MGKNKQNKELRSFLRKAAIKLFEDNSNKQMNYKQVAGRLNIKDQKQRKMLLDLLREMAGQGELKEHQKGKFSFNKKKKRTPSSFSVIGVIDITKSGNGFLVSEEREDDLKITKKNINTAFHGDEVSVKLKKGKYGKTVPQVQKIIQRKKTSFVGVLKMNNGYGFVVADSDKVHKDFYIDSKSLNGAKDGQKVIVELIDWPDPKKSPFGKITEVLGTPGDNETEIQSIIAEHDLPHDFPDKVKKESENFTIDLDSEEIKKRRDFRSIATFTIDPSDAKDFDDALSYQKLDNGNYEIGIHIADVAYYVTPGSELDQEAYKRANSVYLVDRVIPMLPEQLSNLVCSLRPDEEKFVFSAVFELTPKAKVVNEWFGKGVIRSDKRFAYEDAQRLIKGEDGDFAEEIRKLDQLAKILREERFQAGALEIVSEEFVFTINEQGLPTGVELKKQVDANKLIEEFMLLANRNVAKFVGQPSNNQKPYPFIYRIHDFPDPGKLEVFKIFIQKFGFDINTDDERYIAKNINQLLTKVKGSNEYGMIQQMAIKSMAKAEYSTTNIGHYGLHFDFYTHFTSPIRRYADLIVHRILNDILNKKNAPYNDKLNKSAKHTSNMERKAVEAERDSNKYFQALFMQDKVGDIYEARITGITNWGIYAKIIDFACEGMIALGAITDDHYHFDEKNYRIVGARTGKEYNLGDSLNVQIVRADPMERKIDLEIPYIDQD